MKLSKYSVPEKLRRMSIIVAIGLLFGAAALPAEPAQAATGGYCSKAITYIGAGMYSAWLVPADSNNNQACRLDQGANSSAVVALQKGLNGACAVSAGLAVDGQFGPATKSALIRAQMKFGVAADGIYGPNTARAFQWTSSNGTCHRV